MAVGREQWRRRVSFATLLAGVALSLVLGTCGHDETAAVASPTAPVADRLTVGAAPPIAPTVDLAAKNLTATAYRPTVNIVTHGPTTLGTPSHGGPSSITSALSTSCAASAARSIPSVRRGSPSCAGRAPSCA